MERLRSMTVLKTYYHKTSLFFFQNVARPLCQNQWFLQYPGMANTDTGALKYPLPLRTQQTARHCDAHVELGVIAVWRSNRAIYYFYIAMLQITI